MKYLLSLSFLLFALFSPAQDPNYIAIDRSKGLPSNSVYDILQDQRGFIWVATEEGLSRYDGYQFKTFSNPHQTSKAGSEIQEDRFGRIWYENFDGYLYYVENDSLKALQQNTPEGFFIYGISQQSVFVIQEKGIDMFDLQTLKKKQTIFCPNDKLSFSIFSGNQFFVNVDSLLVLNDQGLVNKVDLHRPELNLGIMATLQNGETWLYEKTTHTKTCYKYTATGIQPLFSIIQEGFIHTSSFTDGNMWFCTPSGAFAYDSKGKPLENGRVFFPGKSISCVIKDRENNYWFSTTNEGLLFVADFSSRRYFNSQKTTRLNVLNDQLYFGTQMGEVWKVNPNDMTSEIIHKQESFHSVDLLKSGDAFSPLFFVTDRFGILPGNSENYSSMKDCAVIAPGTYACTITGFCGLFFAENGPDNYWKHLVWGAPARKNVDGTSFGYILVDGMRGKSVAWDSTTQTIYYATNKGSFAATKNGLREIKRNGEQIYFSTIVFYKNALYGLSTQGELLRMSNDGQFESLNDRFGITGENLKSIKLFGKYLFMYSSDEISYVDLDVKDEMAKHIPAYTSDINDIAVWRNSVFVSTPDGILSLPFEPQKEIAKQPLLVLNYLFANNSPIDLSKNNCLSYEQNNIAIGYSILSFKTGSTYPLYYKLNNDAWELCQPDARTLKLASLSPGDYTIQFRLGEKQEARSPLLIHFAIDKPWWYKWWAIGLYAGLFMLALFLIYKRQLKIQERKNALLREKIELEKNLEHSILTSIKSQMNPHFFYNALNTIQSFIYSNDKQNAGNYLSKFSKLTRMVLEMSDKELITLQEEITACRLYLELEQARFGDEFQFTIDVKGGADLEQTRLPSMIIQPYIENAVKHGLLHKKGEKKLNITFERTTENLIVLVDDNGIGRQRSAELNSIRKDKHQSFSNEANQKRLELLNKGRKNLLGVRFIDKMDKNGQSAGTTVIINIPI